ncbi:MAG TPA: hypothetical protein DD415_05740 [Clostridiales bacterium]|nr:hypothetical protein [Clostridiales bacterium]
MNNKFGDNLKLFRTENKLSQAKLANMIGVTQQCVSEWEQYNMEPTLSNLWILSDVFDISIDELVGRKEY